MSNSANETIANMLTRRSIRKYKPDMLPKETIDEIIKAGTFAASGMNKQPSIIVAVTNKELRDRLSAMNAKIMGINPDHGEGRELRSLLRRAGRFDRFSR